MATQIENLVVRRLDELYLNDPKAIEYVRRSIKEEISQMIGEVLWANPEGCYTVRIPAITRKRVLDFGNYGEEWSARFEIKAVETMNVQQVKMAPFDFSLMQQADKGFWSALWWLINRHIKKLKRKWRYRPMN